MKLWQEFKAFAFKGNMIDLAVAVVIGAAFSGVINSLVKDIIMPSISYVTTTAKSAVETTSTETQKITNNAGATNASTQPGQAQAAAPAPPPAPPPAAAPAPADDKAVDFTWTIGRFKIGDFIGSLLNFLLVAFAVFILIVKMMGGVMKKVAAPAPGEPTTKECPKCLSMIPYKATKCSQCTADLPAT